MSIPQDQVQTVDGSVSPRPDWAYDERLVMSKADVEKFGNTDLAGWPRLEFEPEHFKGAAVILRPPGDIIYQFFGVSLPKGHEFQELLAETVDSHFGSTDDFRVDYVEEVGAWGLLAKAVRDRPLYNEDHYILQFLRLVDAAIEGVKNAS